MLVQQVVWSDFPRSKFLPMEEARAAIIQKYKQSLNEMIEKYEECKDEGEIVDVFVSEEESEEEFGDISFMRSTKPVDPKDMRLVSFRDVYTILCTDCDFEDIYRMLG